MFNFNVGLRFHQLESRSVMTSVLDYEKLLKSNNDLKVDGE